MGNLRQRQLDESRLTQLVGITAKVESMPIGLPVVFSCHPQLLTLDHSKGCDREAPVLYPADPKSLPSGFFFFKLRGLDDCLSAGGCWWSPERRRIFFWRSLWARIFTEGSSFWEDTCLSTRTISFATPGFTSSPWKFLGPLVFFLLWNWDGARAASTLGHMPVSLNSRQTRILQLFFLFFFSL